MKKEIEEIENFRATVLERLGKKIHLNEYVGSGKHTSKGNDYILEYMDLANRLGIKFKHGNDAVRGGFSGEYIIISKHQKSKLEKLDAKMFLLKELKENNFDLKAEKRNIEIKLKETSFIISFIANKLGFTERSSSGNYYKEGEKPTPESYNEIKKGTQRISIDGLQFYNGEYWECVRTHGEYRSNTLQELFEKIIKS